MKNFVIATVSAVALLGTAVYAEGNSAPKMGEGKPAHQMAGEQHCAPHHKKHHAHAGGKKHHHHHVDRGHRGNRPLAVFVHFPPVNVAAFSACPCEYYQGNQSYGYIYHEGYYWYPQMRADLLMGYTPHFMQGYHWYPSRLHPQAVYAEGQSPLHPSLYPVPMEMAGTAGMGMGPGHRKHHGKRHHHARAKKHHHHGHHGAMHHAAKHNTQPMPHEDMHQPMPEAAQPAAKPAM